MGMRTCARTVANSEASTENRAGSETERSVVERSAREGSVREGSAREGSAREGSVREGKAREGNVREESVREESVREGSVREGSVRERSVRERSHLVNSPLSPARIPSSTHLHPLAPTCSRPTVSIRCSLIAPNTSFICPGSHAHAPSTDLHQSAPTCTHLPHIQSQPTCPRPTVSIRCSLIAPNTSCIRPWSRAHAPSSPSPAALPPCAVRRPIVLPAQPVIPYRQPPQTAYYSPLPLSYPSQPPPNTSTPNPLPTFLSNFSTIPPTPVPPFPLTFFSPFPRSSPPLSPDLLPPFPPNFSPPFPRSSPPLSPNFQSARRVPSVAEFLKVGPPIFSALALSYGIWLAARAQPFGGETPRTMTREWIQASDKLLDAWPREAGSPVVMNPISRQNAIKN
ncbi:unnamed protein product [Closterium sp. Naga37s-1]|nr:unnamed protein product [Closterium sp. Naga37s-1]